MELGNKIKTLRLRAGLTQEMLAEELGVSFQTISKWENSVCAPDVAMLPKLSVYFGVTIDELFDLTAEQRLHRIENMLDMEQELPYSTFTETADFLEEQLEVYPDKGRIYSFLAHLYHHRMSSDSEKVSKYVRKAIRLRPDVKDAQWLLQKAEGAATCDWNCRHHNKVIAFYKEIVDGHPELARNYYDLLDNLLADNRTREATEYLDKYAKLKDARELQVLCYQIRILLKEHKAQEALEKMLYMEKHIPNDGGVLFELAGFYADMCEYEKAIEYYSKSFELEVEQQKKPLYTDALWGMAICYEILGKYKEAIEVYDRLLKVIEQEWNFTEGEPVREVLEEKMRVMNLMG